MRFSLSAREKRMLIVLAALLTLTFWYKVFWENLLPRYRELLSEHYELSVLEQELPELVELIRHKGTALSELYNQIDTIKNRFVPGSGLLIHTLARLAEDKVTILKIEPESNRQDEYYQVNSFRLVCVGNYLDTIRYLQLVEEQTGLNIGAVDLTAGDDPNGLIQVSLLLEHYLVFQEEPVSSIIPSTLYEPYSDFNPFNPVQPVLIPEQPIEDQMLPAPDQEASTEMPEEWPLAPYTFPAR